MKTSNSSGVIGLLYAAKDPHDPKQPLFGIKVRTLKHEQKIWKKISKFPLELSSIPNFYGSFKEDSFCKKEDNCFVHMVFDPFTKSLKTLIEENIQHRTIPFGKIEYYFKNIVNSLAFLENEKISHQGLLLENIWLNHDLRNVYLIDFVKEVEFENAMNQTYKNKIFANLGTPQDKMLVDPYKSNVFALGLIILELGRSKIINFSKTKWNKEEFEKKIKKQIRKFEFAYLDILKEQKEKEKFLKFSSIIKECLNFNPNQRPDFLKLFCMYMKNDGKSIQLYVLDKNIQNGENFEKIKKPKINSSKYDDSDSEYDRDSDESDRPKKRKIMRSYIYTDESFSCEYFNANDTTMEKSVGKDEGKKMEIELVKLAADNSSYQLKIIHENIKCVMISKKKNIKKIILENIDDIRKEIQETWDEKFKIRKRFISDIAKLDIKGRGNLKKYVEYIKPLSNITIEIKKLQFFFFLGISNIF